MDGNVKLARLRKLCDRASAITEELRVEAQDLQDTWEDHSERWQESDRGQEIEDAIAAIQESVEDFDNARLELDELLAEQP